MILPPGFRLACLLRVKEMGGGIVAQFGETKTGEACARVGRRVVWKPLSQTLFLSNFWIPETVTCRQSRCCISGLLIHIYVHRTITVGVYDISQYPLYYIYIHQASIIKLLLSQSQTDNREWILVFNLVLLFGVFVLLCFVLLSWEATVHRVSSLWLILKSNTTRRGDYHMKMSFYIIWTPQEKKEKKNKSNRSKGRD